MHKCFVIMPFSKTTDKRTESYWTDHFEKFLKPKIESIGQISAERSKAVRGDIVREIISSLISSDIVIADLTDANPNVYWELGVRQSFKHGTITIMQEGTKLPFDVSGKATLTYYPDNHIKNSDFELNLRHAIKDCINNTKRPDSHVLEVLTGRGSFYEIIHEEESARRVSALVYECGTNANYYVSILSQANKNQENPAKSYSTNLLRLAAIELLITTRYLAGNDQFYQAAEKYYDHLNSINGRILMWPQRADAVEKWLIKAMDKEKTFDKFINLLKQSIKKA